MARLFVLTCVTPNQISFASFVIGLLSGVAFALGYSVLGGLLAQASSIVDGVDGDLARLKGMASSFGGFFDAVLDRYADAAIILGMIYWSSRRECYPGVWPIGLLALVGSLMISYSRARSEASTGVRFSQGLASFPSRDARLFAVMAGAFLGQIYWTLALLAILTNAVVIYRIVFVSRSLGKERGNQ